MGWIPALAAAGKRRREQREEREMIQQLQRDDPQGIHEYKVLRSHTLAFAREARLRSILDEEARAGWEMAAKLDAGRLMLRRPRTCRDADALLPADVDPYRISVDPNVPMIAGLVIAVILALVLLGGVLGKRAAGPAIIIMIGIIVIAAVLLIRGRR
jgi:hypothetical protein